MSEVRIFLGALNTILVAAGGVVSDDDDIRWMRVALEEAAAAAAVGEVPIGCVLVCDNAIVGRGRNAREIDNDPTAHAELFAIREASRARKAWRLGGVTAYVTLEPCAMCAGALVLARVDRVVYGAADPKAGALQTLFSIGQDSRLNHRFEVTPGVLAAECAHILSAFFVSIRARNN